jgi:hypothetical protein
MTLSQNSMTEVRLFSFLFSMWKPWTSNKERYYNLCSQFLLHDDYFYTYFSHWNPMVRAYFQRLICWRVARFSANPTLVESYVYPGRISLLYASESLLMIIWQGCL